MTKLQEIVKKRVEELRLKAGPASLAAGLSKGFIYDILRGKKNDVKAENLVKLARALRLDPQALSNGEAVPVAQAPSAPESNASFPPRYQSFTSDGYVPLRGQSVGGPNGRFILNGAEVGRLFVPPTLEGVEGAYAVRVFGTSMEPRFKAGETVWINPHEPVRSGDDVIVQILTDEENQLESYIKEFKSQSAKVTRLWQHNPDDGEENELAFKSEQVFSVHKIVFHATM